MAKCPVCEAQIIADFGLIECESCGAQLLVQVDGRVEHQGADTKQVLGPNGPEKIEVPPTVPPLPLPSYEVDADDGLFDFSSGDNSHPGTQILKAVDYGKDDSEKASSEEDEAYEVERFDDLSDAEAEPVEAAHEDVAGEYTPSADSAMPDYDFDDPGGGEPPPPAYNSAPSNSPDLSDIARFGNSDLAGSRDGALRYTLFIEGIDTLDVRAAFREAITDRKFVWDIDSILRQVRNGEVTIQNVAPSKAHILIARLRNLPVKVRWEQYAISQT